MHAPGRSSCLQRKLPRAHLSRHRAMWRIDTMWALQTSCKNSVADRSPPLLLAHCQFKQGSEAAIVEAWVRSACRWRWWEGWSRSEWPSWPSSESMSATPSNTSSSRLPPPSPSPTTSLQKQQQRLASPLHLQIPMLFRFPLRKLGDLDQTSAIPINCNKQHLLGFGGSLKASHPPRWKRWQKGWTEIHLHSST